MLETCTSLLPQLSIYTQKQPGDYSFVTILTHELHTCVTFQSFTTLDFEGPHSTRQGLKEYYSKRNKVACLPTTLISKKTNCQFSLFCCSPMSVWVKVLTSIAVLYDCSLTDRGSQIPNSDMSTIVPFTPSTPQYELPPAACLA